jgi:hypothetical protein
MAATMFPRATALGAMPFGGETPTLPLHDQAIKTAPPGASTTVAPSRTGNGAHGQGLANDPRANTVATKAEEAAAQARANEQKTIRAHKAQAQSEGNAQYAGSGARAPEMHLTDQIRSGGRAFQARADL